MLLDDGESHVWPNAVSKDFIDDQVGWRLLDLQNGLYRLEETGDSGQTWIEVKTVAWIGQLDFVNPDEGWVIAYQPPERGVPDYMYVYHRYRPASLLYTHDGGQTWEELQPVLGP